MAKTLDFTKTKKKFLTVKLDDADKTVLAVNTPQKEVFEALVECGSKLDGIDKTNDPDEVNEALAALYEVCAIALSNNKNGKHFTAADLGKMLSFEDLVLFFTTYMDFVGEVAAEKN